ncbi:MAG TPA: DUF2190 family protein [Phycisphaerae bacterium]|nr:DUF2190 family protein [Phycisphaerae bacterium]
MNTFYQNGERIDYLNGSGATIASGTVVDLSDLGFGIAVVDIPDGVTRPVTIVGVHTLDAAAADDWDLGDTLYWDATNEELTDVASGNEAIGFAAVAKAALAVTARILLNGLPKSD